MEGAPKVDLVIDGGKEIQDNVDDVEETIILGIILTIAVVYLFLANGRSTFITGLALPNSLIGSFILMKLAGFSLNVVSLLALTLAVGLLIDDAIVVRENIFRKIEDGMEAEEAARKGTLEVQLAVIATTLVVISVFSPVAMMAGVVGKFLVQFGLTVCFAMVISLFDALTIAPMLSAYLAGPVHKNKDAADKKTLWSSSVGRVLKAFDRFQTSLEHSYEKFLPEADNGQFTVELELPPGANLEAMNEVSFKADEIIRKNPEVELSALTVGGKNGEAYKASFFVQLVSGKKRSITTSKMKIQVREQLKAISYANPLVKNFDATGGGQTQPITLNLISINQKDLMDYAPKLIAKLKSDPRITDPENLKFRLLLILTKPRLTESIRALWVTRLKLR
jgi:HAE1 family hydrophobic/amphiphilic exporter-1